jgi:hypothetical protein
MKFFLPWRKPTLIILHQSMIVQKKSHFIYVEVDVFLADAFPFQWIRRDRDVPPHIPWVE